MPLQLQFGGGAVRSVPTLDIRHWRRTAFAHGRAVFRPGSRTLLHRFGVTVVAMLLAGALFAIADGFQTPEAPHASRLDQDVETALREMRDTMREAEWRQVVERTEATQREREARVQAERERLAAIRAWVTTGASWGIGLLAFLGVMAPVSCAWNRLVLTASDGATLHIRHAGALRTRSTRLPLSDVGAIRVTARETWSHNNHGGRVYEGWRWRVVLTQRGTPMPAAEFWVDQDKRLPMEGHMTGPTRAFAEALATLTGIAPSAPEVQYGDEPRRRTVTVHGEPVVTRQMSARLDDLPDDVREAARAALRDDATPLRPGAEAPDSRITVRDADGTVRTYESPGQMPEALRTLYEKAKRRNH